MNIQPNKRRHVAAWTGLALGALLWVCGAAAQPVEPGAPEVKPNEQFVSIDFNNVDISLLIKFMSELTGTNFVVDNAVKGKVTIISPARISLEEAYKVFESVLEVNGFTTVKAGEVVKIIPAPEARTKNIQTLLELEKANPEDKVITQLIPLKYADPEDVKRLFTPLVSKNSIILGYAPANTLIITDMQSNIQRLAKILKQIDQPGTGQQISIIPLQNADATKLVTLMTNLFKTTGPPRPQAGASVDKPPVIVADERTNTIVILASDTDTLRIKNLIALIDKETPRGRGGINVYYCEHASAEDLAKVLQNLPSQQGGAGSVGGAGGTAAPTKSMSAAFLGKVQISADKATNSLIIMADKEDYEVVEAVIKKLDIPRSMVYIESLIMEVDAQKSLNIGIRWQLFEDTRINGNKGVYGGGFSGSSTIADAVTGLVNPTGLALGLLTEPFTIGGVTVSNITAIINAVKTDNDFRILSTPQILTTDNEEARITVGENRPFQTQATTAVSGGTYESYEYRDIGKILKITPHVSEGRNVRLKLSLEVTSLDQVATIATTATRPVTQKRTIDTTVLVQDNHTIVIGGLIDDSRSTTDTKVPGLADIPLLGWLFRNQTKGDQKTNLYVFLTPRVIKSPEESDRLLSEKRTAPDNIPTQVKEGEIKLEPPSEATRPSP